jgi:hypothetical protein
VLHAACVGGQNGQFSRRGYRWDTIRVRRMNLTRYQKRFLSVLWQICDRKTFPVRVNLVHEIYCELYDAWSQAREDIRHAVYAEYRDQFGNLRYVGARILPERLSRKSDELISAWLTDHRFEDLEGGVPRWLFEWIQEEFINREERDRRCAEEAFKPPATAVQEPLNRTERPEMMNPPWTVPLFPRPLRGVGEGKRQYLRRELKLFKTWQHHQEEAVPRANLSLANGQRRKAGNYEPTHFEFLALQYCGMSRKEVFVYSKPMNLTPTAITNGAKSAARLLGLKRPRAASGKSEK